MSTVHVAAEGPLGELRQRAIFTGWQTNVECSHWIPERVSDAHVLCSSLLSFPYFSHFHPPPLELLHRGKTRALEARLVENLRVLRSMSVRKEGALNWSLHFLVLLDLSRPFTEFECFSFLQMRICAILQHQESIFFGKVGKRDWILSHFYNIQSPR